MADRYDPVPLDFPERPPEEMRERAQAFYELMSKRRSVRDFSDRPVPRECIASRLLRIDSLLRHLLKEANKFALHGNFVADIPGKDTSSDNNSPKRILNHQRATGC